MGTVNIHPEKESSGLLFPAIIADTMHLLSGKWTLPIVAFLLTNGKTRFMDIQRGLTGISARVLSQHLQQLEQHKLLTRTAVDAKLTVVNYELTQHGKTLEKVILSIAAWADEHAKIDL